jgi:hypothetical protein
MHIVQAVARKKNSKLRYFLTGKNQLGVKKQLAL